ncbi:MAG TPA: hypothetical protein VJR89_22975 [Polyangiales bacterium]|nr:hypothetical protein [Polyangiales bacterium]
MLGDPNAWYFAVPGVTTTGPFNPHFVRDIGMIYLFIGVALALGAARPPFRVALWAGAAVWLCGHALFHFWEVAAGICGVSALSRDFAGVTAPAVLALALAVWAYRRRTA